MSFFRPRSTEICAGSRSRAQRMRPSSRVPASSRCQTPGHGPARQVRRSPYGKPIVRTDRTSHAARWAGRPIEPTSLACEPCPREREERHEVSAGVITHLHPRRVSRAADRAGAGNANSGRARCTRGASLLDELRQVRRLSGRVPLSSRAVQPARHPAAQTARSLGPSSAERRRAPSRHPV